MTDHCQHCPGSGDPRHADPEFAKAEAQCAFYEKPENQAVTGPGRKRKGQMLTSMTAVRFAPEVIDAVKEIAFAQGVTVGSWIRRAVQAELNRAGRERPTGLIEGSGRLLPPRALRSSLTLGSTASVTTTAGSGLTFRCAHMAIGNVVAAECAQCGPLSSVA